MPPLRLILFECHFSVKYKHNNLQTGDGILNIAQNIKWKLSFFLTSTFSCIIRLFFIFSLLLHFFCKKFRSRAIKEAREVYFFVEYTRSWSSSACYCDGPAFLCLRTGRVRISLQLLPFSHSTEVAYEVWRASNSQFVPEQRIITCLCKLAFITPRAPPLCMCGCPFSIWYAWFYAKFLKSIWTYFTQNHAIWWCRIYYCDGSPPDRINIVRLLSNT